MGEKEDIISLFPDHLLHDILSFLPTKDAVSCCLLSKRWRYLWMSTTKLEFYCTDNHIYETKMETKAKFIKFVQSVLRFHSSSITRFRFCSDISIGPESFIESCISAAVQRHVQEVHLSLLPSPMLSLPDTLCSSNFLTVLEVCSDTELNLPSVIRFSSLKNLTLQRVRFPDDDSFVRFFSDIPVLESLKLVHCDWFNSRSTATIIISLWTLKSLTIEYFYCTEKNSEIKFDIENLKYLKYSTTDLCIDLVLPDMPLLVHASIIMVRDPISATTGASALRAPKLFNSLRFAKSLRLDKTSLELLDLCISSEEINIFAEFVNLTALELDPGVTNNRVLMDILRSSPLLESVALRTLCDENLNRTNSCPQCIKFRLKECSLLSFSGCLADIAFVRILLKNAKALERIKLYCTKDLCNQREKLYKIIEELEELPRISNNCVIEYLEP